MEPCLRFFLFYFCDNITLFIFLPLGRGLSSTFEYDIEKICESMDGLMGGCLVKS